MKQQFVRILVLAVLLTGSMVPAAAAQAATTASLQANSVPLATLLNADGTLKHGGSFQGSYSVSNYNVQMDPQRGPVFDPQQSGANAPYLGGGGGGSSQWSQMGNSTQPLNGTVNVITISGSDVYLGGHFTNAMGNQAADYLVKWDGTNWSALGNDGLGGGSLNGFVNAIVVIGTDVYIGGGFANVNNGGTIIPEADYVAMWNGSNWAALQSNGAGDGALNDAVLALATSGTDLYIGGWFTDVHNGILTLPSADYITRWDGTFFHALGTGAGNGSLNAKVNAIVVNGSNIYAGGSFMDVNNNGTLLPQADFIAKWDGSNWSALQSNGAGNGALNNDVEALALDAASHMETRKITFLIVTRRGAPCGIIHIHDLLASKVL